MILSPQTIQTEPYYSAKLNEWMDYKEPRADMGSIDSWATNEEQGWNILGF